MNAAVLPTHTPQLFAAAVQSAADLLRSGQVIAIPTETVYGLAANALDLEAVSRIFEIKGRPPHNPIIVHVAGLEMARRCAGEWQELAQRVARAFWPGPLTMVLRRSSEIPEIVTGGGSTVGIRWPSHPFIQAVIRACGFPLAAPSANPSNQLSPTSAEHVLKLLGGKIPLIVDGGQCQVGIESTVLDLSVSPPRLLRPGMIHEQALLAVTGELAVGNASDDSILKSPGQLPQHYAPKAKLVVLSWSDDTNLRRQITHHAPVLRSAFDEGGSRSPHSSPATRHPPLATFHIIAHTNIPSGQGFGRVSVIPHDAEAFARAIYAELHQCDEDGVELIVVEALPETDEWRGIADRLNRAASGQKSE